MIFAIMAYIGIAMLFAHYLIRSRLEDVPKDASDVAMFVVEAALWPLLWPAIIWLRRRK